MASKTPTHLIMTCIFLAGCAGGTIGTGVRKIQDFPQKEAPTDPVAALIPKWLKSHMTRCVFDSPRSELRIFPERASQSVYVTSNRCEISISPEDEKLHFELVAPSGSKPTYTISEKSEFGAWREIQRGTIYGGEVERTYRLTISSRLLVRGRIYRLNFSDLGERAEPLEVLISLGEL